MKGWFLTGLGFLVLAGGLGAQDSLLLMESNLYPQEFFVGEDVELRLTYQNLGKADVYLPDEYPEQPFILIKNIRILPGATSVQIVISFVPYVAGTRSLPRLKLGDLIIDNFRINTKSVLTPQDVELRTPRESLLLPYTELVLVVLVALLLLFPVGGLWAYRRFKEPLQSLWKHWARKRPFRAFLKDLKRIRLKIFSWDTKEFYYQISRALRQYTSSKTGENHQPLTSSELSSALGDHFETPAVQGFMATLKFCDIVVYGDETVSEEKKHEELEHLNRVLLSIENKDTPHVDL